ncbi:MAG TPA: TIGR03086 family metal-binding protein [Micropruina sp.]|nr:TIGR03086 family metal-binding protein [Micropruina sp.]
MTNTITIFTGRADRFSRIVAGVGSRWDDPSPCEGWTAADVVRHVIDTERDFLVRHGLLDTTPPATNDPAEAWRAHLSDVAQALATGGVAERPYDGYFGPTTIGDTMADFYGWDLVVHGWDVARATGQDGPITDDDARTLGAIADGWGAALHSPGVCAPALPVPDGATPVEQLLARLGRDPHWTAPGS